MPTTGAALARGSAVAAFDAAGALADEGLSAAPALGGSLRLAASAAPALGASLRPAASAAPALGASLRLVPSAAPASGLALAGAVVPAPRSSSCVGFKRSSVWSAALALGPSSAAGASLPGLALALAGFSVAASG